MSETTRKTPMRKSPLWRGPLALSALLALGALGALGTAGCTAPEIQPDTMPDSAQRQQRFDAVSAALEHLETEGLDEVLSRLSHADFRVRRAALLRLPLLAQSDDQKNTATPAVIALLGTEEHTRVRTAAVRSLRTLAAPAADVALIDALCDRAYNARLYAWKSLLGRLNTATSPLLDALKDGAEGADRGCPSDGHRPQHTLAAEVRRFFEESGARAVPSLGQALEAQDTAGKILAFQLLAALPSEDAQSQLPRVFDHLHADEPALRLAALEALRGIGDVHPDVMPLLLHLGTDDDAEMAEAAAKSIAHIHKHHAARPEPPKPQTPPSRGLIQPTPPAPKTP
ncbi:MAG: HEAT repeat domain-containing protein [Proteobacteria bacterium]|nr:HEAT repeat domain-containing protein [Pseudomonadota bacterium]